MKGTANGSVGGKYCGRAVNGVSNLCTEDLRQIETHRAKDRPTPWPHLAARYGVNATDLRRLMDAEFLPGNAPTPPMIMPPMVKPERMTPQQMLRRLWIAGIPVREISAALRIEERSVSRMRERLGLPARRRGAS